MSRFSNGQQQRRKSLGIDFVCATVDNGERDEEAKIYRYYIPESMAAAVGFRVRAPRLLLANYCGN
jgi:hypothetical protein